MARCGEKGLILIPSAALLLVSVYGGYFGAGLSIVILAIVQVIGYDGFHQANAIKNFLAASFSTISIMIFGLGGLIAWPEALALASEAL